jgi:hypothetical protein
MLQLNKAKIDAQLKAQCHVVRVSPHRVVVGVIYYHFEVCSSFPNYR